MSEIVKRIDLLLAQRNENRNNLQKIGIKQQTISAWYINNRVPRADDLHKIAQYLNVSMEYILTGEEKKTNMEDIATISKIKLLNDEQKGILQNLLDYMVNLEKTKNAISMDA